VIAPDQRGYGRTTGWDADYDGDLHSFRLTNLVRDALGWCRRSATQASMPWSGTISEALSPPGARCCARRVPVVH